MLITRCLLCGGVFLASAAALHGAEALTRRAALDRITAENAQRHTGVLADDTFEGREAGSRGGRAAAIYLVQQLKAAGLAGAAQRGSYYQPFGAGCSNILCKIEGSDLQLRNEVILISAHYDHVGYGSWRTSFGPVGLIHNGADDNASGVAGLIEVIRAISSLAERPKRTIVFAFWDGEEKGLLGSLHWLDQPTVPLASVRLMLNLDMIGRMRASRVDVYGTRTMPGLRRIVSQQNDGLDLNFTWEMKNNSDHYSFFSRGVPIVMLHTGLHGDYHRPSDDVERLNHDGIRSVAQLLYRLATDLADQPQLPRFRRQSYSETHSMRQVVEQPLAPIPGRLGVLLAANESAAVLREVVAGSPADRAMLRAGDRIVSVGELKVATQDEFRAAVLAAPSPVQFTVERKEQEKPFPAKVVLDGSPVRVGISWRADESEPGTVAITRVVPGSPADSAGLKVHDRIYEVAGKAFTSPADLAERLRTVKDSVSLLIERRGRVQNATLDLVDVDAIAPPVQEQPPVSN